MLRFAGRIAIFCVAVVAEVAESADAMDSKSISRKGVGVQVPPSAPQHNLFLCSCPAKPILCQHPTPLFTIAPPSSLHCSTRQCEQLSTACVGYVV